MDLEGTEICDWITRQGVTCIVLKYRVPQAWRHDRVEKAPKVQLPLQDAQRAIGLLRYRASSYGIDPHKIGVIGFSAEIRADAPPTLLIHSMNDPTDDVRHSMAYGLALNDVGVKVDMHLYARGGHAFGMRPTSDPITTEWPELVKNWLHAIKVL